MYGDPCIACHTMLNAQRAGKGFKKEAWRAATADLNQRFSCALEMNQLKSRLAIVSVTAGYKCVVTAIQILVALLPFYRQLSQWWRPGCCRSRPSHRQRVPGGRAAPTLQSLGFVEAPLAWTHAERGRKLSRGRQAAAASVEFEKLGQRGGTRG